MPNVMTFYEIRALKDAGLDPHDSILSQNTAASVGDYFAATRAGLEDDGWRFAITAIERERHATLVTNIYEAFEYGDPLATWLVMEDVRNQMSRGEHLAITDPDILSIVTPELLEEYEHTHQSAEQHSRATPDIEASVLLLDDSIRQIAGAIAVAKVHREADRSEVAELSDRVKHVLEILRQVPSIVRDELPALQTALDEFASRGENQAEVVEDVRRWIKSAMQSARDTLLADIDFDSEYLIDHIVAYAILGGPNATRFLAVINKYSPGNVPTLQYPERNPSEGLDEQM